MDLAKKIVRKTDSNRTKLTKNLHNLNHKVSLYIDGYHFFKNVTEIIYASNNYVKNQFNEFLRSGSKFKMKNDFENSIYKLLHNSQKFDDLKIQRMKRAINSLDEHEKKTNLSIAAELLVNYIQTDIEDTMKANLEKKRPNDKFYNEQDITHKSVDIGLEKPRNELINDFQKKTKKRSYKINVNYEIKFFCGEKPNLKKIALYFH